MGRMKGWGIGACLALAVGLAAGPGGAQGPGIPKVTFQASEVGSLLFHSTGFTDRVPKAFVMKGYVMITEFRGSRISVWDFTNPKAPKLVGEGKGKTNGDEHYVYAFGEKLLCGGAIVDVSDPLHPRYETHFPDFFMSVLPAFQYPYAYNTRSYDEGGKSSQLSIIDFSQNPPKVVKQLDVQSIVGFTTGSAHVIGNLLLITSGDRFKGVAAFDIGDPVNPKLLGANTGGMEMYQSQTYGQYVVTSGPNNDGKVSLFDFTDPENLKVTLQKTTKTSMGDYAHFQNGIMYGGNIYESNWVKIDLKDLSILQNKKTLNTKTSRYVIPFGNMLFVGDHADFRGGQPGSAAAFFVHDANPDAIPPSVLYVNPKNGATNQPVTSRVGLAFDEDVDNRDLNAGKVIIRPQGGQPLQGMWTHSMGVANFTPSKPLERNVTYEVVVPKGAVKDWTGNPNATEFVSRFSTGGALATGPGNLLRPARGLPGLTLIVPEGAAFEGGKLFDMRGRKVGGHPAVSLLARPGVANLNP